MKITSFRFLLLTFAFVCLANVQASAQSSRGNYNFLDFQQKPYYFGITLAYNKANFKVFQSNSFIQNDTFSIVESVQGPGFNLGIVTNLKIGDYFDIRFLPTLSFGGRNINYTKLNNPRPDSRKVDYVFVEMPFHVRYKSAPYKDMRLFVIAGVKYGFDVANDARARNSDELVKIAPSDFAFETGAGVQFFFPYFIFSPEIKMSYGLGNVLIFDDQLPESSIIDKILSRTFTLSFHFEG